MERLPGNGGSIIVRKTYEKINPNLGHETAMISGEVI
jgi:hypothetical protein